MARKLQIANQLSAVAVAQHVADASKTQVLNDGGGLYLRKSGASWCWYFRSTSPVTKKRVWYPLCEGKPYSQARGNAHSTLAVARLEAEALRVSVRAGTDINIDRQKRINADRAELEAAKEMTRRAVTLRHVFEQWRSTDLHPHIRADGKRTGRKDGGRFVAEQFERHVFPTLADVPFDMIRRVDLLTILDTQKIAGKLRTANVLLADLKQLFRFAVDREIIDASPIERIKKDKVGGADVERNRHLSLAEIRALPARIQEAKLAKRTELAIWIILATGARVGELMGSAWSDHKSHTDILIDQANALDVKCGIVNLMTRQWYIKDTKNQRDHTIHLSEFALEKFRALGALREHDDWIFPDSSGSQPVCVKSFGKQIADRQRSGQPLKNRSTATQALILPDGKWTAHDLRRTAASLMAGIGVGSDVINECLNHKQSDRMARVYIHDRREVAQGLAYDALGRKLFELTSSAEDRKVTPLLSPRRLMDA